MEYITYRQELLNMNVTNNKQNTLVSNYVVNIFSVIKGIIHSTHRGSGYLNYISRGYVATDTYDVLTVLKLVIDDNEMILDENILKNCKKISTYIQLITENIDQVIRSNPNIIYDEDEDDEGLPEININCDMISETFALITDVLSNM
jgi:hypothetical protein